MAHRIFHLAKTTRGSRDARALRARRDYKLALREKVPTVEIYSPYATRKKPRFAWSGATWNRLSMMTFFIRGRMESLGTVMFLLFTAASKRLLVCGTTENPRRDGLGWFCDNYCTVILRCTFALSVTFCQAAVYMKFKCAYSTVYIKALGEITRHEFIIHKSLIGNILPDTISLSLGDKTKSKNKQDEWNNGQLVTTRTMDYYRNSPTIKFSADVFPSHKCPSMRF